MDEEPPYDISVTHIADGVCVDDAGLRRAIESTLARHGRRRASVSVAIVDDPRIAELNQSYLGSEGPTDVIAFDLRDDGDDGVDGELVLSIDTAARQARRRGHSTQDELMLYAVHGTLHLLGYEDLESWSAEEMHETEDLILSELGVGPVYSTKAG